MNVTYTDEQITNKITKTKRELARLALFFTAI